jgi:hypothetical protein
MSRRIIAYWFLVLVANAFGLALLLGYGLRAVLWSFGASVASQVAYQIRYCPAA